MLSQQKSYEAALSRFQRAEQIDERCFGADTLPVAHQWRNIALTYESLKNVTASREAYRTAIDCLKVAAGTESMNVSFWLREYAHILRSARQFGEAEQAEVEALRIQVRNAVRPSDKTAPAGT